MKFERKAEYERQFTRLSTPYASEWPDRRPLKIFALDPLRGKTAGNEVTITIPYEKLTSGPASDRIKVIDYDGTLDTYYAPVDLDEGPILMRNGLDPTESDPRFHQQMVYAVTMRVLENFERALGRRVHFKREKLLQILPHAFRGANAFFDPRTNSVLFGYFSADEAEPGENLPGQTIFSCLSHDIVAHEVTHAIVHRLREHYNEPTNRDVLAFHEAIADIVAIFQHFTIPEVLRTELQRQHGDLSRPGTLLELAKQFGHGTGRSEALRTALGPDEEEEVEPGSTARKKVARPKADHYKTITEPHARGSLLVSAVFDAFFVAYQHRIRDVVRLATNGTGVLPQGDIPSDLVTILAAEAATAAQQTLAMCIRAFEFLPPVDVEFGDYLRALVTADRDLFPEDRFQMRSALIEAFRVRGIYPRDVDSLSEESLVWPTPKPSPATPSKEPLTRLKRDVIAELMLREVLGTPDDDDAPESPERFAAIHLSDYARVNAAELKLSEDPSRSIRIQGFHPTFRVGSNGRVRVDVHAQFIQEVPPPAGQENAFGGLPLYNGTTVVFGDDGAVRYLIAKPLAEHEVKKQGKDLRSLATIRKLVGELDDIDYEMPWRDAVFLERRMIERANFAALDRRGRGR